jgi:hypothetical protein
VVLCRCQQLDNIDAIRAAAVEAKLTPPLTYHGKIAKKKSGGGQLVQLVPSWCVPCCGSLRLDLWNLTLLRDPSRPHADSASLRVRVRNDQRAGLCVSGSAETLELVLDPASRR